MNVVGLNGRRAFLRKEIVMKRAFLLLMAAGLMVAGTSCQKKEKTAKPVKTTVVKKEKKAKKVKKTKAVKVAPVATKA